MSGEDTELDKNVIEEILDPLTHMVRNAVDHGVEHSARTPVPAKVRRDTFLSTPITKVETSSLNCATMEMELIATASCKKPLSVDSLEQTTT